MISLILLNYTPSCGVVITLLFGALIELKLNFFHIYVFKNKVQTAIDELIDQLDRNESMHFMQRIKHRQS